MLGMLGFSRVLHSIGGRGMKIDERAIVDAIIAELMRQSEITGCATDTNGRSVQVDGSFNVERLAAAIVDNVHRQLDETTRPLPGSSPYP
jgi:hypothetical protein